MTTFLSCTCYILNVLFPITNMSHLHIALSNVVREYKNYYYCTSIINNTARTAATLMGGFKNTLVSQAYLR